jgi:CheY-like chemotaxis protein
MNALPLTILLVEDDEYTQQIYQMVCKLNGFTLVGVKDVESAFNALETCAPHVIVVDLMLEETSGYDFMEQLRHSELFNHCPVIASTAYHASVVAGACMLYGFDYYLAKPFDPLSLGPFLREAALSPRPLVLQLS